MEKKFPDMSSKDTPPKIIAVKNTHSILSCAKCSNLLDTSGDLCSKCGYTTYKVKNFAVAVTADDIEPSLEEVRTFIKEKAEAEEKKAASKMKRKKLLVIGGVAATILCIVVLLISSALS